jgi:kynureninase
MSFFQSPFIDILFYLKYIVESQIKLHSLNPDDCMILVKPREGESCIRTEDVLKVLNEQGSQIALVLFSGVQYYTGQLFKIKEITEAAQKHV